MTPVAIEVPSITRLVNYTLSRLEASTIVVCCSREDFLTHLCVELEAQDDESLHLHSNTLRMLSMSSQVRMVFAHEMVQVRAYLSSLTNSKEPTEGAETDSGAIITFALLDQMRASKIGRAHV